MRVGATTMIGRGSGAGTGCGVTIGDAELQAAPHARKNSEMCKRMESFQALRAPSPCRATIGLAYFADVPFDLALIA